MNYKKIMFCVWAGVGQTISRSHVQTDYKQQTI